MRAVAVLLAAALATAACGGDGVETTTTADPRPGSAAEFAFTARRALADTRFEALGDEEVASLVVAVCDDLTGSSDPDATVLETVRSIDVPPGDPVDDEIMAVVLAEGALAVCPDVVDAAGLRAWEAAPPEDRFLTAVTAVVPRVDADLSDERLLSAGRVVCTALEGGSGPQAAVVALFADLFGVEGVSVGEIAAGDAGEREGLVAGAVLGAAASFLCPDHRGAVTAYLESLAEETAG